VKIESDGALEIAKRSRGTPRIANNLLRWVRDYAETRADSLIYKEVAHNALEMWALAEEGLVEMDKRILTVIL
jgi:Holliday junction DNA helicase RuvB